MTYAERLPPSGSSIRFTVLPLGSWATVGETYVATYSPTRRKGLKVIHSQTSVHLQGPRGATYDSAWAWTKAQWEVVA